VPAEKEQTVPLPVWLAVWVQGVKLMLPKLEKTCTSKTILVAQSDALMRELTFEQRRFWKTVIGLLCDWTWPVRMSRAASRAAPSRSD
jgi:hypothetical protein